jgi:hypothetical protein
VWSGQAALNSIWLCRQYRGKIESYLLRRNPATPA